MKNKAKVNTLLAKTLSIFIIFMMVIAPISPTVAYAGNGVDGGGSSNVNGKTARRIRWEGIVRGETKGGSTMRDIFSRYGSVANKQSWESLGSFIKRSKGKNDTYLNNIQMLAFTVANSKRLGYRQDIQYFYNLYWNNQYTTDPNQNLNKKWPYSPYLNNSSYGYGFDWGRPANWCDSDWNFNKVWMWDSFPAELKDPNRTGYIDWEKDKARGTIWAGCIDENGNWMYRGQYGFHPVALYHKVGGTWIPMSAIWTDPDLQVEVVSQKIERTKIIYVKNGSTVEKNYPASSQTDLQKIFDEAPTEAEYYHKTAAGVTNETHTVTAKTIKVTKIIEEKVQNGTIISSKTTYTSSDPKSFTKNINYNITVPVINQEKYRPLVLNRNGYADFGDIDSSYVTAPKKIDGVVDNKQGITDNKELKSLDTNIDLPFKLKFNNNFFGLPATYNWNNTPAALANGTYENVNASLGYANNRNNAVDSDGNIRYDLKMYASISNNTENPSINSSSLLFGDDEKLANEAFVKATGFTGGDFNTRFTYADRYTTDNNQSGSAFPQWWIAKYKESRFYEYGTEYRGKINLSGVQNPYAVNYGTGAVDGSNYKVTTNANASQRGLYVGRVDKNYEQPLFFGKWRVATVAGDIN